MTAAIPSSSFARVHWSSNRLGARPAASMVPWQPRIARCTSRRRVAPSAAAPGRRGTRATWFGGGWCDRLRCRRRLLKCERHHFGNEQAGGQERRTSGVSGQSFHFHLEAKILHAEITTGRDTTGEGGMIQRALRLALRPGSQDPSDSDRARSGQARSIPRKQKRASTPVDALAKCSDDERRGGTCPAPDVSVRTRTARRRCIRPHRRARWWPRRSPALRGCSRAGSTSHSPGTASCGRSDRSGC